MKHYVQIKLNKTCFHINKMNKEALSKLKLNVDKQILLEKRNKKYDLTMQNRKRWIASIVKRVTRWKYFTCSMVTLIWGFRRWITWMMCFGGSRVVVFLPNQWLFRCSWCGRRRWCNRCYRWYRFTRRYRSLHYRIMTRCGRGQSRRTIAPMSPTGTVNRYWSRSRRDWRRRHSRACRRMLTA